MSGVCEGFDYEAATEILEEEYFDGLKWLALHEEGVKKMIRRFSRGVPYLDDDIWGQVVDKVQQTINCWDPDKGASLNTHMFNCLRLYAFKYWTMRWRREGKHKDMMRLYTEDMLEYRERSDIAEVELVELIREKVGSSLTDFEWWLIEETVMGDKTIYQIYREYDTGMSISSLRLCRERALDHVREVCRRDATLSKAASSME